MNREKENIKNLNKMAIMMFMLMIIYNLGHPATPSLIELRHLDKSISGVFLAAMSVMMFMSSPYLGAIADQLGKKKMFLFIPFGYGISQAMFGLSGSLTFMIISRLLSGIFSGATYSIIYGHVSENSSNKNKTSNIAKISSAAIIGSAVGLKLGGFIATINTVYPFVLQLILTFIMIFVIYFYMSDDEKLEKVQLKNLNGLNPFSTFKYIKDLDNGSKFFVFIIFLSGVGIFSYNSAIIYFLKFYKKVSPDTIGTFSMFSSLLAFFGTSYLLKKMVKKYKESTIYGVFIVLGLLIMILSLFVLRMNGIPYILFSFYTMTYEIVRSLGNSILARKYIEDQGKILGISTGVGSLGMAVGSLISGYILKIDSNLPFITNIVIMSLVLIFIFYIKILRNNTLNKK